MKNRNITISLLTVPLVLFAQSNPATSKIQNLESGALPEQAEVVLDLPGQGADTGEASVVDEETISVDFPDEDVRTILRSVAALYDLNLVIPDGLQGRTSVKLNNITWDQVFEVVLEPLGYTFIEDRNIIRVKSIEELTAEPVDTRIFILNYARADELQTSVESLVDPAAGGNIQVDARSNALVIKERPSRMGRIESIIETLDQPTEQVMIESKFVEVSNTEAQNIGINWTSLSEFTLAAGSALTGEDRSLGGVTSLFDRSDSGGEVKSETAVLSAEQFDAIISALDTNNDVELVSNPTVVTLNNTSAKIAIGERYPLPEYSFNAQTGERQLTGFEFIDIGINLDVVPSVNDAGFINLDIIPEVSSIGETVDIEGTQIPRINSRRTEANVTLKSGHTLAIGGLSSEDTNNKSTKVPLIGSIPGVGKLFRSKNNTTTKRNLIIFITAKTLDPDGSDYRDVVDPRVLNEMSVVPSDLPGYEVPVEDAQIFKDMETFRLESKREDEIDPVRAEVEAIKEAKRVKELKEQKKQSQKEKRSEAEELSSEESVGDEEQPAESDRFTKLEQLLEVEEQANTELSEKAEL